jgi:hypothetical protein
VQELASLTETVLDSVALMINQRALMFSLFLLLRNSFSAEFTGYRDKSVLCATFNDFCEFSAPGSFKMEVQIKSGLKLALHCSHFTGYICVRGGFPKIRAEIS